MVKVSFGRPCHVLPCLINEEGGSTTHHFFFRKVTLELSHKFDFQSSTTKTNNGGYPTAKTEQVWSLGWFQRWPFILLKIKIFKFKL